MSFQPGVPLPMTRPLYATTTVPSGTMMVQMAPVRPVTMVPVSQVMVRPVMRPVISQSQGFVQTIPAQPMPQMMTNQIVQSSNQQIWIQSSDVQKSATSATTTTATTEETKKDNDSAAHQNNSDNSNDPAITVFVGNITDRASDTLVRQMLMKCGLVYTWKRVQGPSGKLQAFGFCEYKDPESALRAIYVLRDYMLGDKKLLVKVDSKTQDLIDEWKKQKGITDDSPSNHPGVEETRTSLNMLIQEYASELNAPKPASTDKEEVMQILKPDPTVRESQNVEENLQELELEEDQKNFISKEIRSFRETQKLQEEKLKTQKEKSSRSRDDKESSSKDKSSSSRSSRSERDDRDKRTRSPRSNTRRSRSISPPARRSDSRRSPLIRRKRSRSPVTRVPIRRSPPRRRTRSPPPPRRKTRSPPPPRRKRSSSRSPMPWRRGEDDEDFEAHERRKLERKIKEKETAYQERLRLYETRERRQKRLLEKRDERQETERKEMIREAKRLREFLADYEDDRSDNKYYVGNSLSKRLREREREIEADERDRKKEKEEIEILRKRLVEENHSDPDAAIAKVVAETDEIWKPLIEPDTPPRKNTPPAASSSSSSDDDDSGSDDDSDAEKSDSDSSDSNYKEESPKKTTVKKEQMIATLQPVVEEPVEAVPVANHNNKPIAEVKSEPVVKIEFGSRSSPAQAPSQPAAAVSPQVSMKTEIKTNKESTPELTTNNTLSSKRRKLTVSDVFNQDEEEDELPKRRKLVPLAYTDEERKALNPAKAAEDERKLAEEKRKMVRALIERIPTQKDDLFDYNLDWSMVDNSLMEKRIRPWITKKIIEYIGEEEPTLVEFICSKIMTKSSPEKILEDISMVLDEEADVFVVKMWRLLIYETEAKKEGLTK